MKSEIYFCDQMVEIKQLQRKNLPPKVLKSIRALHKRRPLMNARIPLFILLWILFSSMIIGLDSLWSDALSSFVLGWIIVGFSVFMHDAVHDLVSRKPRRNRSFGCFLGLAGLVSFTAYQSLHLAHHRNEHTKNDPDDPETYAVTNSFPLFLFYSLYAMVGAWGYLVHVARAGFRVADELQRHRIVVEYLLIFSLLSLLLLVVPFDILFQVWIIPWVVSLHITSFRGLPEHAMTTGGNPFTSTRSIRTNWFVRFFMCNANYHLEHHLFPRIPWYNLHRLHLLLAPEYPKIGASAYQSYTRFYLDFVKAGFHGVYPNVRLIPKHLREQICG